MNKKESIFKTGIRLFAAQGFEASTTLQIAREVQATEPAVFYHFKSKNNFFPAILEQAIRFYIDRINARALNMRKFDVSSFHCISITCLHPESSEKQSLQFKHNHAKFPMVAIIVKPSELMVTPPGFMVKTIEIAVDK